MRRKKKPMSETDVNARSKRLGGAHTFKDLFDGDRSGTDGAIHRAGWGDSPADFEKAVELEFARRQSRFPKRFIKKVAPSKRVKPTTRK